LPRLAREGMLSPQMHRRSTARRALPARRAAPAASFLAVSPEELRRRGAGRPDVLLVSGDAYVDHPSFGAAVVGRLLESFGLVVEIAAQPDWRDPEALAVYGRPRLFVGVTAGNMDSMVNHLTAHRKRRHDDAYSPGGRAGLRPNRATVVYAQLARRAFPDALVILGGVEASLRRLAHYDYWADDLRRSVLLDARADLLVFGMAERPLRAIVDRLAPLGEVTRADARRLYGLRGTGFVLGRRDADARGLELRDGDALRFGPHGWAEFGPSLDAAGLFRDDPVPLAWTVRRLPSHDRMLADRTLLAQATGAVERAANPASSVACVQRHGEAFVVLAPPAWPLSTAELDAVHELPYARAAHPGYDEPVPAAEMICTSIQITRGCFGGCTFCAIALHEGKTVQSRSQASVLREVAALRALPVFRGTISDLGGPTANLWRLGCKDSDAQTRCRRPSCLVPKICPLLGVDHGPLRGLMRAVREADGVKHAIVSSGVRHDLALLDLGYIDDLVRYHTGGHLHVAPEHDDPEVLRLARKPRYMQFEIFRDAFERARRAFGVERYLNPYFLSGLPGSSDAKTAALVSRLRAEGWRPRQVQSFIPTPATAATAMFWSGRNPARLDERVQMPRTLAEKIRQHELLVADLERGR
jgi:uncharacterized radical SAM protein YgiQ